jgi:hypothetical protein
LPRPLNRDNVGHPEIGERRYMANSQIEYLLSRATQGVRKLLEEAYEAGRAQEREVMKRELTTFLSRGNEAQLTVTRGQAADSEDRAPSGTVKPAIKELIEKAPGIRASDIIEKTGFKDNSVRGTLATLRAEGFAERHGELWVLSQRKGPPALASEPS